MLLDWVNTIWEYNYWGHHKILNCLETVSESDFKREVEYSIGSLHAQIVHTMWAEEVWLARIQGRPRPDWSIESHNNIAEIREQWTELESNWRSYLATLTDDDLAGTFSYVRGNSQQVTSILHEILRHVVNHGTDHRGQMLRIIHDYGGETFEQDMFFYYLERDAAKS